MWLLTTLSSVCSMVVEQELNGCKVAVADTSVAPHLYYVPLLLNSYTYTLQQLLL